MKIQKHLIWIQNKLLNYPDISFKTVKMIIDNFKKCMRDDEIKINSLILQTISELSLQQISIDSFIQDVKVNNFEKKLNNLKERDNNDNNTIE